MANKLTLDQQREALNNALKSFNFPEKYFIHLTAPKFVIATSNKNGGINTHSSFMSYEQMNYFLVGYNLALIKPFK